MSASSGPPSWYLTGDETPAEEQAIADVWAGVPTDRVSKAGDAEDLYERSVRALQRHERLAKRLRLDERRRRRRWQVRRRRRQVQWQRSCARHELNARRRGRAPRPRERRRPHPGRQTGSRRSRSGSRSPPGADDPHEDDDVAPPASAGRSG